MAKRKRMLNVHTHPRAKPASEVTLAQPRHDLWEDREGNARPTPERLAKVSFALRDTEDAGVRHAVAVDDYMLDKLLSERRINPDQHAAGWDYARLAAKNRLVSSGRSCLDFSPVGYDANLPDDPTASQDWRELYLALGVWANAQCRRVCVDGLRPDSYSALWAGLNICVKFFKR